jgi:hypothetical protein
VTNGGILSSQTKWIHYQQAKQWWSLEQALQVISYLFEDDDS